MGNDFTDFAERVRDAKDDMGDRIDDTVEDEMRTNHRDAQQRLATSESNASGDPVIVEPESSNTIVDVVSAWQITAPWPYAAVEFGLGPRGDGEYPAPDPKPPFEAILQWILDKGIEPEKYDTYYGLAEAIQDTIGELGTHSYPFLRPMWRTGGRQRVLDGVSQAMSRTLRRV